MTPSADTFQLTLILAADTTDLPEIRELTMRLYDEMQGSTTGIFANDGFGTYVRSGGNPTARNNRINKHTYAIWIHLEGGGHFENNHMSGNQRGAWKIVGDSLSNITRVGNLE